MSTPEDISRGRRTADSLMHCPSLTNLSLSDESWVASIRRRRRFRFRNHVIFTRLSSTHKSQGRYLFVWELVADWQAFPKRKGAEKWSDKECTRKGLRSFSIANEEITIFVQMSSEKMVN